MVRAKVNTRRQTIWTWTIVVVALSLGTLLSGVIAAALLDVFINRPAEGGGSVTTIIPGFVYATATVLKVCILTGVVSLVIQLIKVAVARVLDHAPRVPVGKFPILGIVSTFVAPLTPLVGTLVVLISQAFPNDAAGPSISEFSQISRTAVLVSLFLISAGALLAVASLLKRERPQLVPWLGLIINAILIGLFWHFEFYAIGFDQDAWAPR